ncbi:hypothetical protein [Streptomyces sp. NPDC090029]|uniref:hypothetical protein n=1 Tax=Streptomyces sp. NPDC090029 TaxID=3365924 RepID=UPI00380225D0
MKRMQSWRSPVSANRAAELIRQADPLGFAPAEPGLSPRALRELSALVDGSPPVRTAVPPAVGSVPAAAARPRRLGPLVASLAGAAAVAAAAVFVLAGREAPGGGLVADEPHYSSAAELEDAADLIVRAKLGSGTERTVDDVTSTEAPADVLATAKGPAPGRSLTVRYTPPGSGGPETADLVAGKEYVLLLERQDDGRFTLVSTVQGAYGVAGAGAVPTEGNGVELSPAVLKALGLGG